VALLSVCCKPAPEMSAGDAKVADVAAKLREQIPLNRGMFWRAFDTYHKTYIRPGRFAPVVHVMLLVGTIGYAIEYPHIKHELEEAKAAESH
jgi:hypothetical protein